MFIHANYNYNNQQSFTAIRQKHLTKLAEIIEKNNPDYAKKSPQVAEVYNNGINFLKGNMPKNKYVRNLHMTLSKFADKTNPSFQKDLKLTDKERNFLNNTGFSLESYYSSKKISKEQLANLLSLLA